MARAIDLPEKETYLLVSFEYGDPDNPSFANYTNRDEDVGPFQSVPSIEVKLPEMGGTLEDRGVQIQMPLDSFTDPLTSGEAFSDTFVTIQEIIRPVTAGDAGSAFIHFRGQVTRTWRNRGGRRDNLMIEALPVKSDLDVPLGLPANHHCVWTLNKSGCNAEDNGGGAGSGKPSGLLQTGGTISSIDNKVVTLTADPSAPTAKHWHRGYMELDGVRVDIRDWNDSDIRTFYMTDHVPSSWVGQSVQIFAGCDKTIETCRARWSNEKNFGGAGYAIPAYMPAFEDKP